MKFSYVKFVVVFGDVSQIEAKMAIRRKLEQLEKFLPCCDIIIAIFNGS